VALTHLAGSLPAALLTHMLDEGWLIRGNDKRVLRVTEQGRREITRLFGVGTNDGGSRSAAR
jgi:hypothetical protein